MLCILSTLRDFWMFIIRAIVYQDIASLTRMGTVHRWRRRKASCRDRWHGRHWEISARFQSRQREFTTNWNFTSRPGKIFRIKTLFKKLHRRENPVWRPKTLLVARKILTKWRETQENGPSGASKSNSPLSQTLRCHNWKLFPIRLRLVASNWRTAC